MIRAVPLGVRAIAGVAAAVAVAASLSAVTESGVARGQSPPAVIDHTYYCATGLVGGIRQVEARAHSGSRARSTWVRLPYAVIASGAAARTPFVDAPPDNALAWITAGRPSLETMIDDAWLSFTARGGGTIGVNRGLCTPVERRLPLTRRGLVGGAVGVFISGFDCGAPRRVLLRVRATVDGGTALRKRVGSFRATTAAARVAKLRVAAPSGRVLAFADVSDSGRARLFTARACSPD